MQAQQHIQGLSVALNLAADDVYLFVIMIFMKDLILGPPNMVLMNIRSADHLSLTNE